MKDRLQVDLECITPSFHEQNDEPQTQQNASDNKESIKQIITPNIHNKSTSRPVAVGKHSAN